MCTVITAVVIWSELTSPIAELSGVSFSVFGRLVQSGKLLSLDVVAFFWTLLPLIYVSACTYTTMWNIRFPYWLRPYLGAMKSFEIHPRQTDTYALLYNSSYISRLQFVICYHCYSTILQVRCVFLLLLFSFASHPSFFCFLCVPLVFCFLCVPLDSAV